MAWKETDMNFHTASGEDYYSQDGDKKRLKISYILFAINSFDWSKCDIKNKDVQNQLAERILNEVGE